MRFVEKYCLSKKSTFLSAYGPSALVFICLKKIICLMMSHYKNKKKPKFCRYFLHYPKSNFAELDHFIRVFTTTLYMFISLRHLFNFLMECLLDVSMELNMCMTFLFVFPHNNAKNVYLTQYYH